MDQIRNQRDRLFAELATVGPVTQSSVAIHGIVFSKDRPLQLDALLESYFGLVENAAPLTILYRPSNDEYRAAYQQIAEYNKGRPAQFIEEKSFKNDLLTALNLADSQRIFFLVDDDIFIAPFDMSEIFEVDLTAYIPSLRLGLSLDYCYPVDQPQPVPPHQPWKHGMSSWFWRDGKLDWGFPMSVDGNIFFRHEIIRMSAVSDFKAPNSYEEALHSFFSLVSDRKGLCYATPRLMNIPVNKVQTESGNYSGTLSSDSLLQYWHSGYRIDWATLKEFANRSAHQEIDLPLRIFQ